jgi:hypothetical protein
MKRFIITAAMALAIVGCTSSEPDLAVCTNVEPWQAYSACVHAQYARQEQENNDAAAMVLLGGTAFLNGWNTSRYQQQQQLRTTTCQPIGMGPMLSCY